MLSGRFSALLAAAVLAFDAVAAEPALSSSQWHTLALDRAGSVYAWGFDGHGQLGVGRTIFASSPTAIAGVPAMASVVAGVEHVAALDTNGRVWTWGSNVGNGLGPREAASATKPSRVTGISNVVAIAAGRDNTFALRGDGTVWVWGRFLDRPFYSFVGIRQIPGLTGITRIDARWEHLVALRNDGTVWTVGLNAYGAIGDGTTTNRATGLQVAGVTGVVQVAAGIQTSVALKADGTVLAWGGAFRASRTSPAPVAGLAGIQAVATNVGSYAVKGDGTVVSWDDDYAPTTVAGFTGLSSLSVSHTDAVKYGMTAAGNVVASGSNSSGELGLGHRNGVSGVVAVPGTSGFVQVTGGHNFAVARRNDGVIFFWGENNNGQLGAGELLNRSVPRKVGGLPADIVAIAAGDLHSLALAADGRVWAWGFGNSIGDPTSLSRSTPAVIAGLSGVVQVSAGRHHSLFRLSNGDVWIAFFPAAEGGNPSLHRVDGLGNIVTIGSGRYNAYAVRSDGALFAWGSNYVGQVGDGTTATRFDPVIVGGITGRVTAIQAQNHVMALTDDGRVWTWGENTFGELGDGTTTTRHTPAVVPGLTGVDTIAVGQSVSIAVLASGSARTWGSNLAGELCDAAVSGWRTTPGPHALTSVRRVAAGTSRSFAMRSDGTVWACGGVIGSGLILDGALGDGTFATRRLPVLVLREEEGNGNLDGNRWYMDLDATAADAVPASAVLRVVPVAQLSGSADSVSLSAALNFRLADYGKTVATFVLAQVPPAFLSQVSLASDMTKARVESLLKAGEPILVQLTPQGWTTLSGQLIALTAGVVNANGNSNNILTNVNITTIPGARFCIGYGETGTGMLSQQSLRDVLTIEGAASAVGGLPCVLSGVYLSGPALSKSGTPVTFTSTVVGLSPDGSVQFSDGAAALGAAVSAAPSGDAVATATYTTSALSVGEHSIGARYLGDARNTAGDARIPLLHRVAAASAGTVTTLTGPVSSSRGDTVRFAVAVTGSNPRGSVQLLEGAASLGEPAALVEGAATISVTGLALGSHTITARYDGDSGNTASTSGVLQHAVYPDVTTGVTLSSNANPASGPLVTLAATVSGTNPSGTVTFRDGSAVLASQALAGGTAQLTTALAAGLHLLRADYSGDAGNPPASSATFFQQVEFHSTSGFTLTVAKSGAGTGAVSSSPAGIDCGVVCAASFGAGATVTLTAAPAAGSGFTGWSGGGCSGTGQCVLTMSAAATVTAAFANPPRLVNIATRMAVLTGDNVLIGGFIIGGSTPKTVVVRARGPSLAAAGVPNPLANTVLTLYAGQTIIASNDDWQMAGNAATLQASGFAPSNAQESAIHVTLNPGAYTAIVQGGGGATGVGIIEIFEVDAYTTPLINIATRGMVLTGDGAMIGGFIIQGSGPQTVVVRARGPSLAAAGVPNALANPVLALYSGQTLIAGNDDWQSASNAAAIQSSGFAPALAQEAAIYVTLNPGAYTAIVTGSGGTTGVGIVEVFVAP